MMRRGPEIQGWVDFATALRPLEQLSLIGLLEMQPNLTPVAIQRERIVGEEKCDRASKWITTKFRELLHAYCRFCAQVAMPVGGKPGNTTELIAAAASLLMATQGIAMAPAVAFAAWAVQSGVKLWCTQFGVRELDGDGSYTVVPYANYGGDFDPVGEPQDFRGRFEVNFYPAIQRFIRDPRYTHRLHEVKIDSPARAEGCFVPFETSCLLQIADHHEPKHEHRVRFRDTRTSGEFTAVNAPDNLEFRPEELRFQAAEVSWSDA